MDAEILIVTINRSPFNHIGTFLQSKSQCGTVPIICHHFVLRCGIAPIDDHQYKVCMDLGV
jgi:hypothetical protein